MDKLTESEKLKIVPGLSLVINFREIRPGIDLQYFVDSSRVKENIILKEKVEKPKFTLYLLNK